MAVSKRQSMCMMVLGASKLTVGIVLMILTKVLVDEVAEHNILSYFVHRSSGLWWIVLGLPFMVSAIFDFGFLGAKGKTKILVGIYMALNIIAMAVSGYFIVMYVKSIADMSAYGISCHGVSDQCFCQTSLRIGDYGSDKPVPVPAFICKRLNLTYSVLAMLITGWLLCLTAFIVCCSTVCCAPKSTLSVVCDPPAATGATFQTYYPAEPAPPTGSPPWYTPLPTDETNMAVTGNFPYSRMP